MYRYLFMALLLMAGLTRTAPAFAFVAAPIPPMGWNSWNYFGKNVTASDIRKAADAMVFSGMRSAGYTYVNIDDTWEGKRGPDGQIHSNRRFPDMKALADYVHSRGLKLGIYSSPGRTTCAGFAGSYGHEVQDARTYARWGVDYLKYDLCSFGQIMAKAHPRNRNAQMHMMQAAYRKMHRALLATGRPMVYSLCQYGLDSVWNWGGRVGGNLWRTTGDIKPTWNRIYTIVSMQAGLDRHAGPGHWNDPDMLEVGNGNLTAAEDRSHFSWWAMLAAPLIAGNDLSHMSPMVRSVLTNRRVIAIDQDTLGREGKRVYSEGEVEVWVRSLEGGAKAIAVFNIGSARVNYPFHLDLARVGLHGPQRAVDLWTGKTLMIDSSTPIRLASHDVLMLRIQHPI